MNGKKLYLVVTLLLLFLGFIGCDKEENTQIGNDEFCLYANVEDFYKTAPFINTYLEHLSKNNLSDEQKLQALTAWLNAKSCIISAELEPVINNRSDVPTRSTPVQPPRGTIAIMLSESGTTRELFLNIGSRYPYESDLLVATNYKYEKPREVIVTFQSLAPTSMVFDFINSFDFEVLWLRGIYYSSTTYSRDYVLDNLSFKPYIAGISTAGPIGNQYYFGLDFFRMENKNYQTDWLKFMAYYRLFEVNPSSPGNAGITFLVPDGKEKEWAAKFLADYEFVISTHFGWGLRGM